MASIHDPIGDVGPELMRRLSRDLLKDSKRLARRFSDIAEASADARSACAEAQSEADRLLKLSDIEAGFIFEGD